MQHFVVSQADLQYKRAILLDEVINVRIDDVEIKPASIVFYQSIHRHLTDSAASSNAGLLSRGKIVIACVQNQLRPTPNTGDNDHAADTAAAPMRPIRVPQKLRAAIEQAAARQSPIQTPAAQ